MVSAGGPYASAVDGNQAHLRSLEGLGLRRGLGLPPPGMETSRAVTAGAPCLYSRCRDRKGIGLTLWALTSTCLPTAYLCL